MNSEKMSNHSSTKNFGKFQCKLRSADVMTFFWSAHVLILGGKMDICGRDEFYIRGRDDPQNTCSILLLRSENIVTLSSSKNRKSSSCEKKFIRSNSNNANDYYA